jgi:hypothetical protein
MAAALIARGAAGLLWVVEEGVQVRDSRLAPLPVEGRESDSAPVFRLSRATAQQFLAAAGTSLAAFEQPPAAAPDEALAPAVLLTDLRLRMQLALEAPIPIEITNMVAYYQGTDGDLGDEIILFVTACDGLWRADQHVDMPSNYAAQTCPASLPIEFARMFNEAVIDLKRPILVLLWGGGEFSYSGLSEWLSDRENFSHLSAPGMRLQPRPALLFQVLDTEGGEASLGISSAMDEELRQVLRRAANWGDIELVEDASNIQMPIWVSPELIPYQSTLGINLDSEHTQQVGESFSLALVRMLREAILNAD